MRRVLYGLILAALATPSIAAEIQGCTSFAHALQILENRGEQHAETAVAPMPGYPDLQATWEIYVNPETGSFSVVAIAENYVCLIHYQDSGFEGETLDDYIHGVAL